MCPDSNISNNGMNDVKAPSGEINDGIVRIRYTRPLNTGRDEKCSLLWKSYKLVSLSVTWFGSLTDDVL